MTYTGDVTPGGPSDVRELTHLTIRKMSVSAMHNNVYLLTCHRTGAQLLIDAADDPERCLALVEEGTGRLDHLVTTHRHWDHTRALRAVAEATGARTYAGAADADALPLAPDVRLSHGDTITVGEVALEVALVSGHTEASAVLTYHDPDGHAHVFTGDCLFPGGVGATQNDPSQSFESLYRDVRATSSTPTTTPRGSTRDTAVTPHSAPNARTCRSGGTAAGDLPSLATVSGAFRSLRRASVGPNLNRC